MLCYILVQQAIEDDMDSLPADASRHNTKRLVADLILLVEHQEIGWSPLSLECLLAMLNSPLELLSSDQDFAEDGIDSGLATVEARCSDDRDRPLRSWPRLTLSRP